MAAEDLAIKNVLTHKGVVFVAIPLVSMYVLLKVFKNRMYAYVLNRISEKIRKSEQITGLKKKLFECIEPGSTIVEVGAGSGANFQFYPEGCTAICVEPKVEFEGYISDSLKKRGEHLKSMRLVKGQGENLSSVVDAATVDYVVSTLVMCSVEDVQKSCSEAYKVLKPVRSLDSSHTTTLFLLSTTLQYHLLWRISIMSVLSLMTGFT